MAKDKPVPLGADGKPMTVWQVWLKRLCLFMIAWAGIELVVGALLLIVAQFLPEMVVEGLENLEFFVGLTAQQAWTLLGASSLISAFLNVVIAFLGIRGAENPSKITLFFWIAFIDALITGWSLVGNISNGLFDPASIVSGLFIMALAICAWQVRKQTGYFDQHP